ncbi:MAG TPA: 4-hydroxy-tetrahydrodipicolinate reductase [Rhodanobacteraceae bacterium]
MSHSTVRVAINGASGRMGQALRGLVRANPHLTLARAVINADSELVGQPVTTPATPETLCYAANWDAADALDVVIDFSSPDGLAAALAHCRRQHVALVVGTTGLSAALEAELVAASQEIPVLRAANFSLGVAVLTRLLREAAAALSEWDIELIEAHHGRKQDAPSGTALALGKAAAQARGRELDDVAAFARHGHTGARETGSIGFAVVRGGDIVGEHTALLATRGERLELTHRATDRAIFARGALAAAIWLAGRKPGLYAIDQVLDTHLA